MLMGWLHQTLQSGRQADTAPQQPRVLIDPALWIEAGERLGAGQGSMLSLWGDRDAVHLGVLQDDLIGILTLRCPAGRFPSLANLHPPAQRLERAVRDLYGLEPVAGPDQRAWLDHGRWGVRHPLGNNAPAAGRGDAYAFRTAEGPPMHLIPVGPVHAGIIEPGHFRFIANGETIVRLEERLGYVHKGIDKLMLGATLEAAARLAGRISGDSTVAYAWAFARAVETALALEPPSRAVWLRAVMAELERLANHFGDIGAICNDAAFSLLHAHCGILREQVLRTAERCFGHRLMMDCIVPGGVSTDLSRDGVAALKALIGMLRQRFPELIELYDSTASLQNRTVTTGVLSQELARQYAAGGYVGRASGRNFDARKFPAYAPYPSLQFEVPVRATGDVDARVWVRIEEVQQSLSLLAQLIANEPTGDLRLMPPTPSQPGGGEGLALIEGFRGDILAWVQLTADARIARCHLRDPSWMQWPLLEAAIEGNIVADFPLCNKSFNCSYSGHDL
jgi:Ni,Fe-hydrogenase III large subunit